MSATLNPKICQICQIELNVKNSPVKPYKLIWKGHRTEFRIVDIVKSVFYCPSIPTDEELGDAAICNDCRTHLQKAHTAQAHFREALQAISSKYDQAGWFCTKFGKINNYLPGTSVDASTATEHGIDFGSQTVLTGSKLEQSMKKTPIGKKMLQCLHDSRKESFLKSLKRMLNQEIENYMPNCALNNEVDKDCLLPDKAIVYKEMCITSPILLTVLQTMCMKNKHKLEITNFMISILSISLYARSQKVNQLQKCVALMLWRTSASKQTYGFLNDLGFSVSYWTALNTIDGLRVSYDEKIQNWTKETQKGIDSLSQNMEELSILEQPGEKRIRSGVAGLPLKRTRRRLDYEPPENPDIFKGLCFSIDNLNKEVRPHEYSSAKQTQLINVVSCIAIFNRINQPFDTLNQFELKRCQELNLEAFIPSSSEFDVIKNDHRQLVREILCRHFKTFARIPINEEASNSHFYSDESMHKSKTVCLGVFPDDENTTEGMISILEKLHRYLPRLNNKLMPMLCWGDGLTADRLRSAQEHRVNSRTFDGKLCSVYPGVSHWHKRVLLLGDDMKLLLKKESLTQGRGTLPQLRSRFGHTQASMNVQNKFNHTFQFYTFVCNSYVCAHALEIMGFSELDEDKHENSTIEELEAILDNVVRLIVDFEWLDVSKSLNTTLYCLCQKEIDHKQETIVCDYSECQQRRIYHPNCVKEHNKHKRLPKMTPIPKPKKKGDKQVWFCTTQCQGLAADKVLQYSKATIFSSLNQLGYGNAIRYNNGKKLQIYNKMHLIQFFNLHHSFYLRICHRVASFVAGCAPPNIVNDILHNSTVNVVGGHGRNISVDLYNEFANKYLKEFLVAAKGNWTPQTIERRSQSIGIVMEAQKAIYQAMHDEEMPNKSSKHYQSWITDLQDACEILISNKVFTEKGVRFHPGFEDFSFRHVYITNTLKYKEQLEKLGRAMDLTKFMFELEFND